MYTFSTAVILTISRYEYVWECKNKPACWISLEVWLNEIGYNSVTEDGWIYIKIILLSNMKLCFEKGLTHWLTVRPVTDVRGEEPGPQCPVQCPHQNGWLATLG